MMGNEKQKHTDTKIQSWEDCIFLVGYMSFYLNQYVYFIGQHNEVNQVKYMSAILLI
jgi:hypothetical protein